MAHKSKTLWTGLFLGCLALAGAVMISVQEGAQGGMQGDPQEVAQGGAQEEGEVNVYSYRQPFLVAPLFAAFKEETGIHVNVIFAKSGLIERMAAEGANSPADVLLTTDIGRLNQAVESGVSQAVDSAVLLENIPALWRDPDNRWFGLTRRARVAFVSRDRVAETALTYESLADPRWRGRVCMRDGQHAYNVALTAAMLLHHGAAETRRWLKGVRANLARRPAGNDRAQVKAVYAGVCDIAISNTYYMGAMQTSDSSPEQKAWAESVRIVFPTFTDGATHVNLSGMVLARHAPHRAAGVRLMEFLSGAQAQRLYAEMNFEYPVREDVAWSDRVLGWGRFDPDLTPLSEIARNRPAASRLVDETGFND